MMRFFIKNKIFIFLLGLSVVGIILVNFGTSYSNKMVVVDNDFYQVLIKNNTILDEDDDNLDGLYYDEKEDSYYFRGNVVNNYMVINSELWRIVGIESNSSIKVIKAHGINYNGLYQFNSDYDNYLYNNSEAMNQLNYWYDNSLKKFSNYIIQNEYCILYEEDICKESKKYSVGLLSVDEVIKAGGSDKANNDAYYLYNENDWWLINTEYDEFVGNGFASNVNFLGRIDSSFVDEKKTLRPVININGLVSVNGDGTKDNPYFIAE